MDDALPMPDAVPFELAGKWLAWDDDALHIVGFGDSMEEALARAKAAGVEEPYIEKTPPAGMGFIGCL